MSKRQATARPWSVAVETEAEDGLTITIPEIGRCLHDWEWADAAEWDRDLANADLIVQSVNERDALLAERDRLQDENQRYAKVLHDRLRGMNALVESFDKLEEERDRLREAAQASLSLLENVGTGKWAKTPAGDKLRAALSGKEGEGNGE